MVIVSEVRGNLLDAKEKYIAQQCNCVTVRPHGLSKSIAERWSHGDVYSGRSAKSRNTAQEPDTPGTVVITEGGPKEPVLLHLMAQWTPSKPGGYNRYYPSTYRDTSANRKAWFKECLDALEEHIPREEIIAVPFRIGCGLAGGNWTEYRKMLEDAQCKIKLYRLDCLKPL